MHELGITHSIVEICAERAQGRRVVAVTLQIGELSGVVMDAIRFCFDVVAQGTAVEDATLNIEKIEGRGKCRDCRATFAMHEPYGRCASCGSVFVDVIDGQQLKVRQMEVQ